MAKFNSFDHNDALRACWDATDFGANVEDADIVILNRAAGSHAFNERETLSRAEFTQALERVRSAVAAAKLADPSRAARVLAERAEIARKHAEAQRTDAANRSTAAAAKDHAAHPAKPGNKYDLRAAKRMATLLGLRDREGNDYVSDAKKHNIRFYAEK